MQFELEVKSIEYKTCMEVFFDIHEEFNHEIYFIDSDHLKTAIKQINRL